MRGFPHPKIPRQVSPLGSALPEQSSWLLVWVSVCRGVSWACQDIRRECERGGCASHRESPGSRTPEITDRTDRSFIRQSVAQIHSRACVRACVLVLNKVHWHPFQATAGDVTDHHPLTATTTSLTLRDSSAHMHPNLNITMCSWFPLAFTRALGNYI